MTDSPKLVPLPHGYGLITPKGEWFPIPEGGTELKNGWRIGKRPDTVANDR